MLQDHGIWLWRSRGEASPSEAWLLPMVRYHFPAGPRAAGGGSPKQAVTYTIVMIRIISYTH